MGHEIAMQIKLSREEGRKLAEDPYAPRYSSMESLKAALEL